MFIICRENLEFGDIILLKSETRESRIIRERSNSEYSHAILYMGQSSYIDSDGLGVQANNIQRLLFNNEDDAIVLRLNEPRENKLLQKIEHFARQKIGTEYSTKEALQSLSDKEELDAKEVNRQFCTRFVTQAYHFAGADIVENFNYPTPNDIRNSSQLSEVVDIIRKASKQEIDYAQSDNPLETQKEIHNSIFEKARNVSNQDIQTFDQLHELIIHHPEYDHEITDFLKKSGYLYMMENDFNKNPWHYDSKIFVEHYKTEEVMLRVVDDLIQINQGFDIGIKQAITDMEKELQKFDREYLKEHLSLYKKLKEFNDMRIETVNEIIDYLIE